MYVHVVNSRRGLPGERMLTFLYEPVVDRQRLHQKPSLWSGAFAISKMAKILRKYLYSIILPRNIPPRSFSSTHYYAMSTEAHDSVQENFEEMFKETQFAKLGRPNGKIVEGKITHIINEDMYIDFGWKFHAVVKIPPSKVNRLSHVFKFNLCIFYWFQFVCHFTHCSLKFWNVLWS